MPRPINKSEQHRDMTSIRLPLNLHTVLVYFQKAGIDMLVYKTLTYIFV